MKKIIGTFFMLVMILCMTGCHFEQSYTVDEKGNVTVGVVQYYSAEEISMVMAMMSGDDSQGILSEAEVEELFGSQIVDSMMIDGVKHYGLGDETTGTQTIAASDVKDGQNEELIISENEYIYSVTEDSMKVLVSEDYVTEENDDMFAELAKSMSVTITVNLPKEIILTNGKLSNDGKTVTFTVDASSKVGSKLYAYTADSDKFALLTGVQGKYTNKSKVSVWTPDSLKSVKLNGTKQKGKQISLKKDGTYNVEVETSRGTTSIEVVKDTVKPEVKGIKSGSTCKKGVAIKCSDKSSGIALITLDGVSVKNGTKVKKAGKHTLIVMDKAGNKKTVEFTVKKK